jgi:hypothetical protein
MLENHRFFPTYCAADGFRYPVFDMLGADVLWQHVDEIMNYLLVDRRPTQFDSLEQIDSYFGIGNLRSCGKIGDVCSEAQAKDAAARCMHLWNQWQQGVFNFESSVIRELAAGKTLLAINNKDSDAFLLIPVLGEIPVLVVKYCTMLDESSKKKELIERRAPKYPTLVASVLMEPVDLIEAWMNKRATEQYEQYASMAHRLRDVASFSDVRNVVFDLSRQLEKELQGFTSIEGFDGQAAHQINSFMKFRLLTRFGSDCWALGDGFANNLAAAAYEYYRTTNEDEFQSEVFYTEHQFECTELPLVGVEDLGAAVPIPDFRKQVKAAEHLDSGHLVWLLTREGLLLYTPAFTHYSIPTGPVDYALGHHGGIYRSLILIAQIRTAAYLKFELETHLASGLMRGQSYQASPVFKDWLKDVHEEMDLLRQNEAEHLQKFDLTADGVIDLLTHQLELIKPWMDEQVAEHG